MKQVTVTFPDGSSRSVPAGTPVRDVAAAVSPQLAEHALAAFVDDRMVDLSHRLDADTRLRIVTPGAPGTLELYRHSTAHLLAAAVTTLFPEARSEALEEAYESQAAKFAFRVDPAVVRAGRL